MAIDRVAEKGEEILFHFSEDGTIKCFVPRKHPNYLEPVVWAIAPERAPLYYFPRDCPRVCFWTDGLSLAELSALGVRGQISLDHPVLVAAIETLWLERLAAATLYRYTLPRRGFREIDANAGYWLTSESVRPLKAEKLDDLREVLRTSRVELRILDNLWEFHDEVLRSTPRFSMIRMQNAQPRL